LKQNLLSIEETKEKHEDKEEETFLYECSPIF